MTELEELYSQKSFQEGKKYFHYANYPYLFKFLDKEEVKTYSFGTANELLVCACISYDLDDLYQIVYDTIREGYYLKNGNCSINDLERLKHPVLLSKTLAELFQRKNFAELLTSKDDADYNSYMENSFHQYEDSIEEKVPTALFPNKDMRLLFKEKYPDGYFTDHKEYNSKKLADFCSRVKLDKYLNINTFFETKPNSRSFLNIVDLANKDSDSPKFLYAEFYQSGYQGIIYIDDLDENTLTLFLKYGIVYNKIDVPEKIYDRLK